MKNYLLHFMKNEVVPCILWGITVFVFPLMLPSYAKAVDGYIDVAGEQEQELRDKIDRLERDLGDLQQDYYRELKDEPKNGGAAGGGAARGDLEARFTELEEKMRQMNGRVEQMEFTVNGFATKLDKIIADIDYRLSHLEQTRQADSPVTFYDENKKEGGASLNESDTAKTADIENKSEEKNKDSSENQGLGTKGNFSEDKKVWQDYDAALGLLNAKEYDEARNSFEKFISDYKGSPLEANARYWIGDSYFGKEDYQQAAIVFLDSYKNYPKGPKRPDSLLKLGMSLTRIDKPKEACTTFAKLEKEYPGIGDVMVSTLVRERKKAGCK